MQREIPILFSAAMVQAILAGRKSQTRRILKWPDVPDWHDWDYEPHNMERPHGGDWWPHFRFKRGSKDIEGIVKCPYGKPGDLLWVRESFRVNSWNPEYCEVDFRFEADGSISERTWFDDYNVEAFNKYWEQSCIDLADAGYEIDEHERYKDYDCKALRLRPNIFMPKNIARIWLEVEEIRCERLQDISEEDAVAEGVETFGFYPGYQISSKGKFEGLWNNINGNESWNANPWVWVVKFKVVSTTGRP